MNGLSLLASIVDSLAWPTTILIVALFFRKSVEGLLENLVNVKFPGGEANFGRRLGKAKEDLQSLPKSAAPAELPEAVKQDPLPKSNKELIARIAEISPSAAVMESWRGVERAIEFYCQQHGLRYPISGQTLLRHLSENPHFPPQLLSAYQELRLLRNRAAHDQQRNISIENAMEFSDLSEKLTLELSVAAFM